MIYINGSQGEGGGQILRSALALSMVTGQPFHITKIRAGREKPGLLRQHLTCVQAAMAISSAHVTGASVGSQEVIFTPGPIKAGNYHFPIGTAGSTTMVLQAILPVLLRAEGPSTVVVEGGTHNGAAPPFEFFDKTLVSILNTVGASITTRIDRYGFFPAGGGRVVVDIQPAHEHRPLNMIDRGEVLSMRAFAIVSCLPLSIAEREIRVLIERLKLDRRQCEVLSVANPIGPGNAVMVEVYSQNITEVFSVIGEVGKSAEAVASELVRQVQKYVDGKKPVGQYTSDQLMVPLAVLRGGRYATGPLSEHARTNIQTVRSFGGSVMIGVNGLIEIQPLAVLPASSKF